MKTTIYQAEDLLKPNTIKHLKEVIQTGGLVVFPTETVYGIGANAYNPDAAHKIYQVKGRPQDNPLIVHIDHLHQLNELAQAISQDAHRLIQAFWPGPLTLIFDKTDKVPDTITSHLNTVAVRMPSNPLAQMFIHATETPICAPSANISGKPSSTLFEHVKMDLYNKVDIIIDGGKSTIGLESTVLDMTTPTPTILRPGSITKAMIENILQKPIDDLSEMIHESPKSPGMKYTHYKPQGDIILIDGAIENVIKYLNKQLKKNNNDDIAVICAHEVSEQIHAKQVFDLGALNDTETIASNLFIALRAMDDMNIKTIYIHTFSKDHLGSAIMNRLLKAAGYRVQSV